MAAFLLLCVCALLSACSALGSVNADILKQGAPIGMWNKKCEGWVVQSGLPVPVGQRMEELDALCPGKLAAPGVPPTGALLLPLSSQMNTTVNRAAP